MFRKNKKPEGNTNRIDSLIGEGTEIHGDIHFKGGVRIEGRLLGNIQNMEGSQGVLVVGPMGVIEGDVRVTHLIVDGCIQGSVYAEIAIELGRTARVLGNIHYGKLEMHSGAVFEGHMVSHETPLLMYSQKPTAPAQLESQNKPSDTNDSDSEVAVSP